jgi:hypothetical protein
MPALRVNNDSLPTRIRAGRLGKSVIVGAYLALSRQEIDHLLDRSRAVHIERDCDQVSGDRFTNEVALLIGRVLEEFLTKIIAKGVYGA